ncbi:hypothetical protein Q1695_013440 [Nippostrongylus brasiliensis]|nr:hypothetical protein Q1695_013440 [Nippostrongylus brasiliensis]
MRGRVVNGGGDFFGNDAAATGELTASLDHVVVNEFEDETISMRYDRRGWFYNAVDPIDKTLHSSKGLNMGNFVSNRCGIS